MGDSAGILSSEERHTAIPFWRDVRVLRWVFQFAILAAVVALFVFLGANLQRNLRAVGLDLNFGFLTRPAGFSISEGPAFPPQNPVWQAYMVGVVNTLRAAGIGILLATLLGTLIGISRLSRNWLLSRIALVYIEIMQNTPLLVQLFFWFTLVKQLPRQRREEMISFPAQAVDLGPIHIPPLAYFSQRGGAIPGIEHLDAFRAWWPFLILGLIAAGVAWRVRVALSERQGHPAVGQFWWAAGAFAAMLAVGWIIVPGAPLRLTIPQLVGEGIIVNYEGAGAGAVYGGLHRGGRALRHPVRTVRPDRGGHRTGIHTGPAATPDHSAAGHACDHPPVDQPVPQPDEELQPRDRRRVPRSI
jgi:general L-amino acid transport system permease protein